MTGYARTRGLYLYNDDVENLLKLSADKITVQDPSPEIGTYTYQTTNPLNNGRNDHVGHGKVNAYRALVAIRDGLIRHSSSDIPAPLEIPQSVSTILRAYKATEGQIIGSGQPAVYVMFLGTMGAVDGVLRVRQHEVQANVEHIPLGSHVWGRGVAMSASGLAPVDLLPDGALSQEDKIKLPDGNYVHFGLGWCEPVGGTQQNGRITLRTFVYEVVDANGTPTGDWIPCQPRDVVFHYTVYTPPANFNLVATLTDKNSSSLSANNAQSDNAHNPAPLRGLQEQDADMTLPIVPTLFAPAPNPTSEETTLSFAVSEETYISIDILSTLGNKVLELVNNQLYTRGKFRLQSDVRRIPSGSYVVRLTLQTSKGIVQHSQMLTVLR